jgi:hypothetical protein
MDTLPTTATLPIAEATESLIHGIPTLRVRTHIRAGAVVTTEETTPPPTTTTTETTCTAA